MKMLKVLLSMSALGLLAMMLVGCSGNVSAKHVIPDNEVHVTLHSFEIVADKLTVPAGNVTFKATNTDVVNHEMLVIPVADANIELPYNALTSRLSEDGLTSMGEVPEIEGNTNGEVTLDLAPGTYILLCNLVGHYQSGMHTVLTVE